MVDYTEQKPRITSGAQSEFGGVENGIPRPEIRISQSNSGSSSGIAFVVVAIVLAVGAYYLYAGSWSTESVTPSVTQNNITLPAPIIAPDAATPSVPPAIAPDLATPPVAEKALPVKPEPSTTTQ